MKTIYHVVLVLSAFTLTACNAAFAPSSAIVNTPPATPIAAPAPPPAAPAPGPANPPAAPGAPVASSPAPAPAGAAVLANIQASAGWNTWGQFPPSYSDCNAPCAGLAWSMTQGVTSPSLSGSATQFSLSGTTPYADVLFSNPLIGQFSTQGLPDKDHSLLPAIHNFIYDADFFVTNVAVTQVLEFDISMYMNGAGMIWGNQCNNLGGRHWDIWDNANKKWVSTGVACSFINNGWNHVTLHAQRQADNTLLYESFTLNGTTTGLNAAYPPYAVPASWWGITVNYQMDGDAKESSNTTYVDNFSLTYW